MVRSDYDSNSINDMAARTTLLFRLAKELKWLSDIHKTCVVVINQVLDIIFYLFFCDTIFRLGSNFFNQPR